ncbi:hypothetical protein OIO90_005314 [Microbotryomycetes sp. JL221]|nr:hypothetical protein OIO90_005314 [Microbotryomycetes sp. JL221]
MTAEYDRLSAQYRQEVNNKLNITFNDVSLDQFPPGSDVQLAAEPLLTPRQLDITRMDATELLRQIHTRQVTAVEALTAFGIRTIVAHKLTCCLTDFFLEDALVEARALDAHLERTGQVLGPLHGLPISAKDQVALKGRITSTGFLSLHVNAKPEQDDCLLAQALKDSGAIFFNHTTLPQTIMHLESSSFWTGPIGTRNPCNTNLSAGGSSGGEGAVLSMRGALIGIGTDIGGSVRSPAAACGLYGLRPTALRIPGVATYKYGRESIMGTAGPLAHSLRDIELFMATVLGDEQKLWERDPNIVEMPWRYGRKGEWQDRSRKLRIGVMWDDGEVRPTKPIQRALESVVDRLKRSGAVEIKEFEAYGTREAWYLARELYFPDAGRRIRDLTVDSEVQEPLHSLTAWLLEEGGPPLQEKSVGEVWEMTARRDAFRKRYRRHWMDQHVDVVLCPNAPYPAPPHNTAKWWAYTSHFNVVDHPAVTFPTGLTVSDELDALSDEELGAFQARNKDEAIAHGNYSPQAYKNAPLCLQLVARRFHDEELLDALKVIEEELGRLS